VEKSIDGDRSHHDAGKTPADFRVAIHRDEPKENSAESFQMSYSQSETFWMICSNITYCRIKPPTKSNFATN
jgi:hypothetical protein